MRMLTRYLHEGCRIIDIGAGCGRYTFALRDMGYEVDAVELVQRNIDVMKDQDPTVNVRKADARQLDFIADETYDVALLFGPMYHLMNDEDKLKALSEAARVTKRGGTVLVAYLMNEYSIVSYCFAENRMADLMRNGFVDKEFHVQTPEGELYDYIRLEDADRLNAAAGMKRITVFSPDGPTDYMRVTLNRMTEENFQLFIDYVASIAERTDVIGAAAHIVDVLKKDK
ncbi:MAG: class I SAM-dependent methyltransferase [Bacteroidaceae bacterium]|nr:class I SAM-dependent methyltransferase [Bacteroidaceae bacterium]